MILQPGGFAPHPLSLTELDNRQDRLLIQMFFLHPKAGLCPNGAWMKMESLTDLLIDGLQEASDAEQQLLEVLPTMSRVASSEELQEDFSLHAEQTGAQLKRVENILNELHAKPIGGEPAEGMRGIIAEADRLIAEAPQTDPAVFDAALIAVAQRAEHYQIAVYGTLRTYAQILGATEALEPLRLTLNEEVEMDRKLTALAETAVNLDAAEADEQLQQEAIGEAEGSNAGELSGSPIK
ncbi:MAG: DUF892 family protein [Verrucomicrobia bacterium]|nr:DUF892 family protein [Verrucomicrobiota bacterium]